MLLVLWAWKENTTSRTRLNGAALCSTITFTIHFGRCPPRCLLTLIVRKMVIQYVQMYHVDEDWGLLPQRKLQARVINVHLKLIIGNLIVLASYSWKQKWSFSSANKLYLVVLFCHPQQKINAALVSLIKTCCCDLSWGSRKLSLRLRENKTLHCVIFVEVIM